MCETFVMSVTLLCSDNVSVTVALPVARMSNIVRELMESTEDGSDAPIPLANVSSSMLARAIAYCELYRVPDNEEAVTLARKEAETACTLPLPWGMSAWEEQFFHVAKADALSMDDLLQDVRTANYLHVQPMLEAACLAVARRLPRTAEKIRELFGIECDFTKEELEQIQEENAWLDENTRAT